MEVTYFEALAAFWTVFWPSVVFAVFVFYAVMSSQVSYAAFVTLRGLLRDGSSRLVLLNGLTGVGLFAFWPQFTNWTGRWIGHRFKIDIVSGPADRAGHPKLTFLLRLRVWFFIFWRIEVALIAGYALATVVNVILLMFAVPSNAAVAEVIAAIGVMFLAGPLILKLLVGNEFGNCRVMVQRAQPARPYSGSAREGASE
jgi:hypothetical protein